MRHKQSQNSCDNRMASKTIDVDARILSEHLKNLFFQRLKGTDEFLLFRFLRMLTEERFRDELIYLSGMMLILEVIIIWKDKNSIGFWLRKWKRYFPEILLIDVSFSSSTWWRTLHLPRIRFLFLSFSSWIERRTSFLVDVEHVLLLSDTVNTRSRWNQCEQSLAPKMRGKKQWREGFSFFLFRTKREKSFVSTRRKFFLSTDQIIEQKRTVTRRKRVSQEKQSVSLFDGLFSRQFTSDSTLVESLVDRRKTFDRENRWAENDFFLFDKMKSSLNSSEIFFLELNFRREQLRTMARQYSSTAGRRSLPTSWESYRRIRTTRTFVETSTSIHEVRLKFEKKFSFFLA